MKTDGADIAKTDGLTFQQAAGFSHALLAKRSTQTYQTLIFPTLNNMHAEWQVSQFQEGFRKGLKTDRR